MQEQLNQIILICNSGQDIQNYQIRSILSSLASNMKQIGSLSLQASKFQNFNQQALRSYIDSQIKQTKLILARKCDFFQSFDEKIEKLNIAYREQFSSAYSNLLKEHQNFQLNMKSINYECMKKLQQTELQIQNQCLKIKKSHDELCKICEIEGTDLVRLTKNVYNLQQKVECLLNQLILEGKPRKTRDLQMMDDELIGQEQQDYLLNLLHKNQISAAQWVDQYCQGAQFIHTVKNKITSKSWANVFGKQIQSSKFSFKVKINRMHQTMGLGFVDCQYKNSQSLMGVKNRVWYTSAGACFDGKTTYQNVGKGFKEGQQIIVTIDTLKGDVQWSSNYQIRHKIKSPLFQNKNINIKWAPYIWFQNSEDSISLI